MATNLNLAIDWAAREPVLETPEGGSCAARPSPGPPRSGSCGAA